MKVLKAKISENDFTQEFVVIFKTSVPCSATGNSISREYFETEEDAEKYLESLPKSDDYMSVS